MDVGLYLHVAFCQTKCYYCDFNTYAGLESLIPDYVDALAGEVRALPQRLPVLATPTQANAGVAGTDAGVADNPSFRIGSIFWGGGTPSLLSPAQFETVFRAIHRWPVDPDAEVSIEANPGDPSEAYFRGLRQVGINRISLGVQSFDDAMLVRLGRRHDARAAVRAYDEARRAGFDNVSIDLMFALPGQTLDHWSQTLDAALAMDPDHISLYNLTIEADTPFGAWTAAGKLTVPDDDQAADMYQLAIDRLGEAGYEHYEISNWARAVGSIEGLARTTYQGLHNLRYWRRQTYFGVGAGAHSFFGGYRYWNLLAPRAYIRRVGAGKSPVQESEQVDEVAQPGLAMAETMILGLRLAEGVSRAEFRARFGAEISDVFATAVATCAGDGLLVEDDGVFRLTQRGRFLGNEVFARFLEAA